MALSGIPITSISRRLYGRSILQNDPHSASSSSVSSPAPSSLTPSSTGHSNSTSEQSFTYPNDAMPPPGPEHYEARRALWLAPPPGPRRPPSPSTSRAKLEALLSQEGAIENNDVWNSGLRSVWKGLVGGGRLRRRLPLAMVLKILQAGWLRDGTWPADAITGPPSPTPPPPVPPVQVTNSVAASRGGYDEHGGERGTSLNVEGEPNG